nr:reverse transcriptase domain-containing protein [Tanacetum cinerariifolium]
FAKKVVTPAPVKAVEESCVTCGGAHAYYNCPNTDSNQLSVCVATGTYSQVAPQNRASNFMAPHGFALGEMKAITTRSGVAYEGPSIPTNPSPKKVVERETEETTDKEQTNFQGSTAHIQPPCMRTRNSYFLNNSYVTISRRRNKRRTLNVVEPELRTIVAPMADNRTMVELLQAPTKGYGEAIVIPKINADHFEIKTNLLQLVQANPYLGFKRENPHTHINNIKRITSTLKFRDVPNDVIKLMMFSYSLERNARVWENASKSDDRIDKLADQISNLVDIFAKKVVTPAPVKAVEESCVTCGGAHAYYNCPNTDSNQLSVCVATGTYSQVAPQNRASNFMAPPGFAPENGVREKNGQK